MNQNKNQTRLKFGNARLKKKSMEKGEKKNSMKSESESRKPEKQLVSIAHNSISKINKKQLKTTPKIES